MRVGGWIVAATAVGLVAACSSGSDSPNKLESQLFDKVTAQLGYKPDSVSCPAALKAEKGATQTCVVHMDDHEYNVVATATAADGKSFDMSLSPTPIGFKAANDGSTIGTDQLVQSVTEFLKTAQGAPAFKVSCPEELPSRLNASVKCYLHSEGQDWDVAVTVTNAEAGKTEFGIVVADKPRS